MFPNECPKNAWLHRSGEPRFTFRFTLHRCAFKTVIWQRHCASERLDPWAQKKAQPLQVALNPPKEEGGGGNDLAAGNAEVLQWKHSSQRYYGETKQRRQGLCCVTTILSPLPLYSINQLLEVTSIKSNSSVPSNY